MVPNVIINNILQLLCLEFPHCTGPLLMWPADGLLSSCFGAEDPGRPNPYVSRGFFAFVPLPGADITQRRSSNDKPKDAGGPVTGRGNRRDVAVNMLGPWRPVCYDCHLAVHAGTVMEDARELTTQNYLHQCSGNIM